MLARSRGPDARLIEIDHALQLLPPDASPWLHTCAGIAHDMVARLADDDVWPVGAEVEVIEVLARAAELGATSAMLSRSMARRLDSRRTGTPQSARARPAR